MLALVASAALTFSACEQGSTDDGGNNNNINNPNNPNNPGGDDNQDPITPGGDVNDDSDLTPGEHKARLEEIAIEFVDAFEPSDVEELIYSALSVAEYAEYFDYGFVGNEKYDNAGSGDVNYKSHAETLVRGLQRFSATDLVEFATRVAEDFVIDINDPELNPYAGKNYIWTGYGWEETNGKDKTIGFEWDETEATISWFGSTKLEYLYDEEENYVVYIPNDITITIKIGGKTHFTAKLETNITDLKTWAPKVTITLNGGYEYVADSAGNSKGLEGQVTFKKNGKTLLHAATVVAINDATDIDNWMYEYYDDYNGEYYTDISDEYFLENVKTGAAQLDILELSIVAEGDFKGMYEEIEEIEDMYDTWDGGEYLPDQAKKESDAICEYVNEKVEIVLLYNDTKERVANIVMSTSRYYDEYDGYTYYGVEPILVFPDGSKFAFEEYFTEKAFGDLINVVQRLAEEFESIIY